MKKILSVNFYITSLLLLVFILSGCSLKKEEQKKVEDNPSASSTYVAFPLANTGTLSDKQKADDRYMYCFPEDVRKKIDQASFSLVGQCFSKDKDHVFVAPGCGQDCWSEEMSADPTSFKSIYFVYAKDKNNVYYKNHKNLGADLKTFEVLKCKQYNGKFCSDYSKDIKNVYLGSNIIKNADPVTFEVISDSPVDGYQGKDKKNVFDVPKHIIQ